MKRKKIFLTTLILVMLIGGVRICFLAKNAKMEDKEQTISKEKISLDDEKNMIYLDNLTADNTQLNNEKKEIDFDSSLNEIIDEPVELSEYDRHIDTRNEDEIVISFAGDILFDPNYSAYSSYITRGKNINTCFSNEVLETMRSADIMMLNNEFPYSDRGKPLPDKTYTFRAPVDSVSLLDEMGVDIVSIANNHMYDYGSDAFTDTIDTLKSDNMPFVGGGYDIEEATKPYVFEANGKTVAFLGATQIERNANPDTKGATDTTPGVFRCFDSARLIEEIKEAKSKYDFVILYVHWGTESTDVLDWAQPYQAKEYVEAGVDAIIGDHPHVLQGITYMDDVPIIYSLGNFWFNSKSLDTCIATLTIDCTENKIKSFRFIPCTQTNMKVSKLDGAEKQRVIGYMRTISSGVTIDEDGIITKK